MSWQAVPSCRKCHPPRNTYTSTLYKVLFAMQLIGSTYSAPCGVKQEDITMFMLKYFCMDGDIKAEVNASLLYGVKKHYIAKKKDRFILITPAAAIHLAPCKCKSEQISRIDCIFPKSTFPECEMDGSGRKPCCHITPRKREKSCRPKKRKCPPNPTVSCEFGPSKKRKSDPCEDNADPCQRKDNLGFDILRGRCKDTPSESDNSEENERTCCPPKKPPPDCCCCCSTESSSNECVPESFKCCR